MDLNKIGSFIAEKRKEKNLTQEQLGKLINVDRRTISKWETGVYAPDISVLDILAESLGVTVNDILHGKIEDNNKDNNSSTITTIKYYNNKYKYKITIIFITIIITILSVFLIFYNYKTKNEYKIYSLKSSDDRFDILGTLIYNSYNIMILIDDINYNDIYIGTDKEIKSKEISLLLYLNDEFIEEKGIDNDENVIISDLLDNISFSYKNSRNCNEDLNVKLVLKYYDNQQEIIIEMPLNRY